MKFSPCNGRCTKEGTHCDGCGRSLTDVADLNKMVQTLVDYAIEKDYENREDFANAIARSIFYKLENPPS